MESGELGQQDLVQYRVGLERDRLQGNATAPHLSIVESHVLDKTRDMKLAKNQLAVSSHCCEILAPLLQTKKFLSNSSEVFKMLFINKVEDKNELQNFQLIKITIRTLSLSSYISYF